MSTIINDPVREVRTLHRFEYVRNRPPTYAERALVFLTSAGQPQTYLPYQQPTRGELVSKNFRTLYEVEMGIQHMSLEHRLPSEGDASFFTAETDLTWRVTDPAAIVKRQVRDVRALIEPRLLTRMRRESRRYAIESSAAAEAAVMEALAAEPLAAAEGLEIRCELRLSLDEEAMSQLSSLRTIDYTKTRTRSEHELTRLLTHNEQEVMEERSSFYATLLGQGEMGRWGAHLAQNPGDIPLAISAIRDDEREASGNQIRIIEKLLDSGVVEDHMVEETARAALEGVKARLVDAGQGRTRKQPVYREQLERGQAGQDSVRDSSEERE
ncbi:hypothetical protein AR457_16185 [Streptomyces agglomeratus]|uniref:PE-PGRS family protein n=1 Tax=Streptomyces agglomeratus TaxID=285458 RepID=A0A1E5P8B8_9ACTN|nr:hypothetical protein [Streptomyces agglomeratus]OEJ25779.1 hypothetical protein AS594_16035 [Streptomyces agglomeratus]OEJ40182.1 hypothetical protein BGK70_20470 [Streptomyces agglomeratus]OEJ45439.1 hypothetical protein AR457_16185 [Streptomyces agglomeratus]OEJ52729.1 hypothetical protein BGK72_20085 [Streptomyces agglomeratus]